MKTPHHPSCGFTIMEPVSVDAIYIIEFWCFMSDRHWGWECYMVTEKEELARETFEQVKRSYCYIRIRKIGKILSLGTIIDHYAHDEEVQ